MDKKEVFKKELNYIKDDKIKKSTEVMLDLLPDYFYKIPASSTGKFHPKYALGDKGLVRHVKAAAYFAKELFIINEVFDDESKDLILMSLLLHDGLKKGKNEVEHTCFDHPILIANYIEDNKEKLSLTDEQLNRVVSMVSAHMGKWNKSDYAPNIILPLPKTKDERFVHMCDYLASRKQIQFEFDENSDILE